jgi:hypothetical protein
MLRAEPTRDISHCFIKYANKGSFQVPNLAIEHLTCKTDVPIDPIVLAPK